MLATFAQFLLNAAICAFVVFAASPALQWIIGGEPLTRQEKSFFDIFTVVGFVEPLCRAAYSLGEEVSKRRVIIRDCLQQWMAGARISPAI